MRQVINDDNDHVCLRGIFSRLVLSNTQCLYFLKKLKIVFEKSLKEENCDLKYHIFRVELFAYLYEEIVYTCLSNTAISFEICQL